MSALSKQNSAKGFALIELLIVISIIAILSVIGITNIVVDYMQVAT